MKNIILILGTIGLISLSCSKEEQAALVNTLLPEKFTATINDTAWSAVTRVTKKTEKGFSISGTSSSGAILDISTVGFDAKKYELSLDILDSAGLSATCAGVYKKSLTINTDDFYLAKKGDITITNINTTDKTISGTFNFKMFKVDYATDIIKDSVVISSGAFADIKYTE